MKNLLLTAIISATTATVALAQNPTLQAGTMVNTGFKRTVKMHDFQSPGGRGGAMVWNFSGLTTEPQAVYTFEVIDAAVAPQAADYITSNIAYKFSSGTTDNYTFLKLDNNGLEMVGEEVPANPVNYSTNTMKTLKFPFNYRESFNDAFESAAGGGTVINEFDAWGSVVTADTTYPNTVRIATSKAGLGVVKYTWYNVNPIFPVAEIDFVRNITLIYDEYVAPQQPIDTTQNPIDTTENPIDTNNTTGIREIKDNGVQVYPNPAQDVLHFDVTGEAENVKVLDISGRVLISSRFERSINVSQLQTGRYFVLVQLRNGQQIRQNFLKY